MAAPVALSPPEPDIASDSTSWQGLDPIRYLFVFGASNCSFHQSTKFKRLDRPTPERPLGVDWGGECWCELGKPNWLGYLVKKMINDGRPVPLVFNYAVGGSMVPAIQVQIDQGFLSETEGRPDRAPWTSENSLFIIWAGGNDCAYVSDDGVPLVVKELFVHAETLFSLGARNFIFMGLPPADRYPIALQRKADGPSTSQRHLIWNNTLEKAVASFGLQHVPDVMALYYPTIDLFNHVLDNPEPFGFKGEDVTAWYGDLWYDHMHPTSALHGHLANHVKAFLDNPMSSHVPVPNTDDDSAPNAYLPQEAEAPC